MHIAIIYHDSVGQFTEYTPLKIKCRNVLNVMATSKQQYCLYYMKLPFMESVIVSTTNIILCNN